MSDVRYQFVAASDPLFDQVRKLRWSVLRAPLGLQYTPDWDDGEAGASHLVAVEDGVVVGYGRLIVRAQGAQIRYMSVAESVQGRGVGSRIVELLIERAWELGAPCIWLNARFNALDFYRKLGFVERGAFFDSEETAIPHKRMEYRR